LDVTDVADPDSDLVLYPEAELLVPDWQDWRYGRFSHRVVPAPRTTYCIYAGGPIRTKNYKLNYDKLNYII
jgi:hypothetical protein